MTDASQPSTLRVWGALSVVYLVWGSTYLAIKWSIESMPPLLSAGVRFTAAGIVLSTILTVVRGRRIWQLTVAQVRNAVLCGLLTLLGGNGMIVLAETRIDSGLAALLVASVPLWVVLLRRVLGDRVSIATYFGVLLGLGGVALLFLPGGTGHVEVGYALIVVAAALSWAAGSLLAVRAEVPAEPLMLAGIEMLGGGAGLMFLAALRGEFADVDVAQVSTKSGLSLLYLVVFGSLVAFSCYIWVFANAPSSVVTTYAYVNPVVAVVLGVLFDDEKLTGTEVLGAMVIVTAVVVVVTVEGRAARRAVPPPEPTVVTGAQRSH